MSDDELAPLGDLAGRGGVASITGNKFRRGLYRLIVAGNLTAQSASMDFGRYEITSSGREVLKAETRRRR